MTNTELKYIESHGKELNSNSYPPDVYELTLTTNKLLATLILEIQSSNNDNNNKNIKTWLGV